jgi:presequence protease
LHDSFCRRASGRLETFGLDWTEYRHSLGAGVIHVMPGEGESFIGVSFRTPAADSRGIPHVLEHCVLNGSTGFPVRDAFNELWRGSLHSHLNAVTGPDRTVYYAGSPHPDDFENIARVYLDLLFRPLLEPRRVSLESFHYRPVEARGRKAAEPSGVVYSEMRGSYSDPEELTSMAIQAAILPGTPYRYDPGGDPALMSRLSYDDIVDYHRRFYHPANAMILVVSPMDGEQVLALLADLIRPVRGEPADSRIPLQKRWGRPRSLRLAIPGEAAGGASCNVSWLLGEVSDSSSTALWQLLEEVLLGDSGPLCRALLDCSLGTDLSSESGIDLELREAVLTGGLAGVSEGAAPRVRSTIFRALESFTVKGPDSDLLDAALNTLLFRYVERSEDFPLRLFLRAARAWTYDVQPAGWMDHASSFRRLASAGDASGRLVQAARQLLLENPHRLNSVAVPARHSRPHRPVNVGDTVFRQLEIEHGALETYASGRDSAADLGSIPRLETGLLSADAEDYPHLVSAHGDCTVTELPLDGSPTVYLEMAFDISDIAGEMQPLIPLLARTAGGMPLEGMSHERLTRAVSMATGSFDCEPVVLTDCSTGRAKPFLVLSCAAFEDRLEDMSRLVADILSGTLFTDRDRFGELVSEMYSDVRSDIVPLSDVFTRLAAARSTRPAAVLAELWEGLPQYDLFEVLAHDDDRYGRALADVERLFGEVFRGRGVHAVVSAPRERLGRAGELVRGLCSSLGTGNPASIRDFATPAPSRIAIRSSSSVSSVCMAGRAPLLREKDAALFTVGATAISDGILYEGVRTGGGSYEVSAWHDRLTGILSICSYRDPSPERTISFLDGLVSRVREHPPGTEDIRLAVLASFAPLERPMQARSRTRHALLRSIGGLTVEDQRRLRASMLAVGREDVADRFPDMLDECAARAGMAAMVPRGTDPESLFGSGCEVVDLPGRNGRGG